MFQKAIILEKVRKNWSKWLLASVILFCAYRYYISGSTAVYKVIGELVLIGVLFSIRELAQSISRDSEENPSILYLKSTAIAAFLGFLVMGSLGTHTEDSDPLFGGGEEVVDYIPTEIEKINTFWHIFLIFSVCAANGIYRGVEQRFYKTRSINEKDKS